MMRRIKRELDATQMFSKTRPRGELFAKSIAFQSRLKCR